MTVETFFANFAHLADAPNGVQKLRDLILQLAVQGELVPQDPEDEPASVLLEKIEVEKKTLIAAKKIRARKVASTDASPYELPENWTWVPIGNICRDWGQKVPDKQFSYIDVSAIDNEKGDVAKAAVTEAADAPSRARKLVRPGTVIYSTVRPYLLNIAVIDKEFDPEPIASTAFAIVHPLGGVSSQYIFWFLRSPVFVGYVESKMLGVAYPAINDSQFFSGLFPLPPLAEQHRIVAKVDQLMALCNELEARQKKQQQGRVRLNNAALDALLTAREPDTFADHWQRISTNFDLLYDHPETIAKLRAAILQLAVQGKLVPQDNPSLWREGVLGDVVDSSEAGWSPQCENRPCTGDEWGVLKVSAVSWGKFLPGENKTLPNHLEPRPRYTVSKGDFLISRANTAELVARSVVVNQDYPRHMMSDKIIRIRFSEDVEPNYLNLVNTSPSSREYYARVAGGTSSSMKNVSRKQILELPVNLPPLEEQKRIVAKVDQLMALCDQLEAKFNQARQQSEKLMDASVRQLLVA